MAKIVDVPLSYLQECFEIINGTLCWRLRPTSHSLSVCARTWNRKQAGFPVSTRKAGKGYTQLRLDGKSYLTHKIVYAIVHNEIPEFVDHIDQNKENNHPNNLRACTRSQNMFNRPKQLNNTSGYKGVSFDKKLQKYVAQIRYLGRKIHIGVYSSAEEAYAAYLVKQKTLAGAFAHGV